MADVSILIAVHGDREWSDLAWSRAYPSARGQVPEDKVHVVYAPSGTLAEVRNLAVTWAQDSEWVCFLDADDELEPGYIRAMERAIGVKGEDALYAPQVRFYDPRVDRRPRRPLLPNRHVSMKVANHCVIGTLVRREAFVEVGGFHEYEAYEDWDLFLRLHLSGRPIVDVQGAIYKAYVDPAGRNSQRPGILGRAYRKIKEANGV